MRSLMSSNVTVELTKPQIVSVVGEGDSQNIEITSLVPQKVTVQGGIPGPTTILAGNGQPRFTGIGEPPAMIVGAQPGDEYLDTASGLIYKLT